jgi:hypothetical protein
MFGTRSNFWYDNKLKIQFPWLTFCLFWTLDIRMRHLYHLGFAYCMYLLYLFWWGIQVTCFIVNTINLPVQHNLIYSFLICIFLLFIGICILYLQLSNTYLKALYSIYILIVEIIHLSHKFTYRGKVWNLHPLNWIWIFLLFIYKARDVHKHSST